MGKGIEWIDIVRTAYEEFDVFPKGTVAQLEAELETEKAAYRIMNGLYEYRVGVCAQLEAALTVIRDVSYDRDGHTGDSVKLGELVDEIYKYAVDALKEGG